MKNIGIPFLIISSLFFSCQKNNSLSQLKNNNPGTESLEASKIPAYFLSCQIDGQVKRFNMAALAVRTTTSWNFSKLEIRGSSPSPTGETFRITIDNTKSAKSIGTGMYGSNSAQYSLEGSYLPEQAQHYLAGSGSYFPIQSNSPEENETEFHTT